MCDNADGIVLDHDVQPGNPADAPRLKPAVERVKKRTGRTPQTVAADRGYGEASLDDDLTDLGVRNVVIPRKGRPTKARQAHERRHLSFAEREEIALPKVRDHGVREIARRIVRDPSTISRELRRNVATRSGERVYRTGWRSGRHSRLGNGRSSPSSS